MKTPVIITGVHLYRRGLHAIVAVELNGVWVEVIKEAYDGCFSHIVEGAGIISAKERQLTCTCLAIREAMGQDGCDVIDANGHDGDCPKFIPELEIP